MKAGELSLPHSIYVEAECFRSAYLSNIRNKEVGLGEEEKTGSAWIRRKSSFFFSRGGMFLQVPVVKGFEERFWVRPSRNTDAEGEWSGKLVGWRGV